MRILLVNVPHPSIGSRIPDDHLPPLGLLSVGGPLIDDGHDVHLLDAEFGPMPTSEIVAEAVRLRPDAVLVGHSRSTAGPPVILSSRKWHARLRAGGRQHASSMAAYFPPTTGARFWSRNRMSMPLS